MHELYRFALTKANADAKAEEERQKEEEKKRIAEKKGIKIRDNPNSSPPPMPNISMDELEEIIEEEM